MEQEAVVCNEILGQASRYPVHGPIHKDLGIAMGMSEGVCCGLLRGLRAL